LFDYVNWSNFGHINANNMLKKSENHNPNYLAKVVKLAKPIQHPNADRMLGWMIDGNRVWTDNINYKEGDIVVYFPLECQINPLILSQLNLFSSADMNFDKTQKGFFDKNGRVRAIRLRGEPSEGFILKIETLEQVIPGRWSDTSPITNIEFDAIDDCWVCKKYVPTEKQRVANGRKSPNKLKDVLIENQFRFHYDTEQLKKHMEVINPDTIITITKKIHGTSGISSNVLTNVKESRFVKFIKKSLSLENYLLSFWMVLIFAMQSFNLNLGWVIWGLYFPHIIAKIFNKKYRNFMDQLLCVPDTKKYNLISASRRVIKGIGDKFTNEGGYYKFDIWKHVTNLYKDRIENGITLYYEIVGYLPDGNMIQKGYDYGCKRPDVLSSLKTTKDNLFLKEYNGYTEYKEEKQFKVQVYRITYTTPEGKVIEYSWEQIKNYCRSNFLTPVKEIFTGSARAFLPIQPGEDIDVWRQAFLNKISQNYFEENDPECFNKVPAEGVVIRIENGIPEAYKFKSFLFLEQESKQLDSEQIDIETEES